MPSSLKSVSTAVDSWPLPATEDDKIHNVGLPAFQADVASQGRRRRALNSRTALGKKPVDRQDTTDGDNHDPAGQKECEVQVDTRDSRPKPQAPASRVTNTSHPAAAPTTTTYTASTDCDDGNKEKKNKKNQKKAKNTNKKPAAEADDEDGDGDAHDRSHSCLPFRHRARKGEKGDKGDKSGRFQKFKMGLFSKKKKHEEVTPYAAAPITPYQQARAQLAKGPDSNEPGPLNNFAYPNNPPPPYIQSSSIENGLSVGKSHSPSGGSTTSRFGDEKFGNQKGYGSSLYDNNSSAYSANRRGPGGYGGLDEDTGKDNLFGDAGGRYVPPQQSNVINPIPDQPSSSRYDNDPSKSALLANAQDRYTPYPQSGSQPAAAADDYDGYGAPRELTEEENEELQVQAIKNETKVIRKEGVASINRTVATAESALNTALGTYARLGEQGDRLHRTERNLDEAAAKSRLAEDKTRELKSVNGSMFAVHVGNPFTSRRRQREADEAVLQRHQMERTVRETTRKDGYLSTQQMEETFKDIAGNRSQIKPLEMRTGEKKKNQFELDSDDDEDKQDEKDIQDGLTEAGRLMKKLNTAARGMNTRVTDQNKVLDRLADKSDAVDDHVRMNRERLGRIH